MFQTAYATPSSLNETLALLDDTNHLSMPLAAGTQLLVDLRHVDMLKHVRLRTHSLEIGAMVTMAQVERKELILQHAPLLAEIAKHFGNPLIRAAATLGGNVAASRHRGFSPLQGHDGESPCEKGAQTGHAHQ